MVPNCKHGVPEHICTVCYNPIFNINPLLFRHHKYMTETQKQALRDEFLNHKELAGQYGYCNPIIANKIVDLWLSKIEAIEQERINEFVKQIKSIPIILFGDKFNAQEVMDITNNLKDKVLSLITSK